MMRRLGPTMLCLLLHAATAVAQYVPPGSSPLVTTPAGGGIPGHHVFLNSVRLGAPYDARPLNLLLDPEGHTAWYHQGGLLLSDFKPQPGGRMSYNANDHWHVLDSHFVEVDSVGCIGLRTDFHDYRITADGHHWLLCLEDTTMDLSALQTLGAGPGSSTATVEAVVVQELDAGKQLLREWHGLHHTLPEEVAVSYFTNPGLLQLHHANSIDVGADGTVLLSFRALDQVQLVDWATGDVLWRLGGLMGEFDLLGDTGPKGQHDARFAEGGITLFDNGNGQHRPRAIRYALDTVGMQAAIAWCYRRVAVNSDALGSYCPLPDGSGLVDFGRLSNPSSPSIQYVLPDCTVVMEITFADTTGSYRAQAAELAFQLWRPWLTCTQGTGEATLGVAGWWPRMEWSTGELGAEIVVDAPGWYQAFVPLGIGMVGSLPLHITDIDQACLLLDAPAASGDRPGPRVATGFTDLLGRSVERPQRWQMTIERLDGGGRRKIVWVD